MKKVIIAICISLLSMTTVFAQGVDDQGNPNDITVNDRANACFEGGGMAGKCNTDWTWTCGWYVMRWEADQQYIVPDECLSLVSYAPPPEPEAVSTQCISTNIGYIKMTGGINASPSADQFSDSGCTSYTGELTFVEAPEKAVATGNCTAIIKPRGYPVLGAGQLTSSELPGDWWYCVYAII